MNPRLFVRSFDQPLRSAFRARTIVLVASIMFCVASPLLGQQDVGSISGVVTDASGQLVPGANVSVESASTGIVQTVVSDGKGFYQSQAVKPGNYNVRIEKQGFATSVASGVKVDAAAHVAVNARLEVGSVSASVQVESIPPSLNTTDAQLGNTIDTRQVEQLPVNGRSVLALATLSPGVESAVGATSEGFANRGTQASSIRISGGVVGGNNNLLDGVSNLQSYIGEVAINVKADAVQEFRIMTGVIPAQFGYTSGGVINIISRSGANRFHGSIYEFLRNDLLDAPTALPKPAFGKPELRFNNFGGALGGPIKRDKLFFFNNYEEYRYISGQPGYTSVPTAQERAGNFNDLGRLVNGVCTPYAIYDPATGTDTLARTAFQGNMIQIGRLDPAALAIQAALYPLPNNTVGSYDPCTHVNNYLTTPKYTFNERSALGRVDYTLSEKDNLFVRYAYYQSQTNNAAGFGPIFNRNDNLRNYGALLSETHVFSPSLVNDVRIAVLRSDFSFAGVTAGQNYAAKYGIVNDSATIAPVISNGLSSTNGVLGFRASTTIEFVDDVTKTLGAHTVRLGADIRFTQGYNNQSGSASGQFNFSSAQTASGTNTTVASGTGSIYASFLLGAVSGASAQTSLGTDFRQHQYAGYVQDDWRATERLTVNAGLRYDLQMQAHERNNGIDDFDITRVNPLNTYLGAVRYAGVNGEGSNFVPENFANFGPRIGFALLLTKDGKTATRGGYAIYYPSLAQTSYDSAAGNPNGFGSLSTAYSSGTSAGVAFQLRAGLPYLPPLPQGAAAGQNAFLGQTGYYVVPSAKSPQGQQYTLTLSRELPFKTVLDVSYLGNHGTHFNLGSRNLNALDPQYLSLGTAYLNAQVANPYAGLVPGSLGNATISRANLLKPFPYMSSVQTSNERTSHYDGNFLYVSAQRRTDVGLQVNASYTYGKVMSLPIYTDLGTVGYSNGPGIQNPRNVDAEYGVDGTDVTHRLIVAGLYDLPFGHNRAFLHDSKLADRLLGGFQVNTIMTAETGRPLAFSGASNYSATRPNLVPFASIRVAHPSRAQWFNPAAFSNPADYTFGNAPRYYSAVRGPGALNFDVSAFKTTAITERVRLELRLEAFNAFNHVNLGMPNTSFSAGPAADPANPTAEGGGNINSSFGTITSAASPRNVQLGAKVMF
ncbi:TonB-dependent receptor [soil metagenome]